MSLSTLTISKNVAFLFGALAVALVVTNAILIKQNVDLRNALNKYETPEIPAGTLIASLNGLDANGKVLDLNLQQNAKRTVLLVFSPSCSFCIKNMPIWNHVLTTIDRSSYQVIGVSIKKEGTSEFIKEYGLSSIPVIAELSPRQSMAYNFNATPMTILVGPDGKVQKCWAGLLTPQAQREIEQFLGLPLFASTNRGFTPSTNPKNLDPKPQIIAERRI